MYLPGQNRSIPIVFEIGSQNTRIGYGGEISPYIIQPSDVIEMDDNQYQNLPNNQVQQDIHGFSKIVNPLQDQLIDNFEITEYILSELFSQKMQLNPEDHPLLMVEPPMQNKDNRNKLVEILFENFGFKGAFFQKAPILASYLFGNQNSIIIDSGAKITQCVPIQEGYVNNKAMIKVNLGGDTLTQKLRQSLILQINDQYKIKNELQDNNLNQILNDIKHNVCKVYQQDISFLNFNPLVDSTVMELPDHKKFEISKQIYEIPEIMFRQNDLYNYYGLAQMLFQTMLIIEPENRKEYLSNIFVVGGNTLFQNFIERFQSDLFQLDFWGLQSKIKVSCPNSHAERQHANWIGGSIMSSMQSFESIMMTKEDYEEQGVVLIEKKCFEFIYFLTFQILYHKQYFSNQNIIEIVFIQYISKKAFISKLQIWVIHLQKI